MTLDEVERVGQALLATATHLSIPKSLRVLAAAGLNASSIPTSVDGKPGMGSRAVLLPAMYAAWGRLGPADKERALPILAEGIVREDQALTDDTRHLLEQHGFRFENGMFIPVNFVDERERPFLPAQAYQELVKAIGRLAGGDESGAVASACSAVESLMNSLYERHGLGSVNAAFAAKVNTASARLQLFERMEQALLALGMSGVDAKAVATHSHEATKHAADVLAVYRREAGDAHGAKPATKAIAYDALKWAAAICGLFEGY